MTVLPKLGMWCELTLCPMPNGPKASSAKPT